VDEIMENVKKRSLNYLKKLCGLKISKYLSDMNFKWIMEKVKRVRKEIDEKS
jgi:glycerol kinase